MTILTSLCTTTMHGPLSFLLIKPNPTPTTQRPPIMGSYRHSTTNPHFDTVTKKHGKIGDGEGRKGVEREGKGKQGGEGEGGV